MASEITSTLQLIPGNRLPPFDDDTYFDDSTTFMDLREFVWLDEQVTPRQRAALRMLRG